MSRYSGPQGPGAAAKLYNKRRAEAEARQEAEREWWAKHRAETAAAVPTLTDAQRAELIEAARKVALAQWLYSLGYPWPDAAIQARKNRPAAERGTN